MKLRASGANIFTADGEKWMLKVGDAAFETSAERAQFAKEVTDVWNSSWKTTELSQSKGRASNG